MSIVEYIGDSSPRGIIKYWERKTKSECAYEIERCYRRISELEKVLSEAGVKAALTQQEAEPVTMNDAIAAGNGTLHGAIDYWQERALKAEAAQPQVPEGIIKIERKFEYFSPVTAPKVVVYFAPDDWEAQDRFALWLSAAKEEGKNV